MSTLTVGQRAVVANMAPEYGATTGFFPVDEASLAYLRLVGGDRADVDLVEAHQRPAGFWFEPDVDSVYTRTLELAVGSWRSTSMRRWRPGPRSISSGPEVRSP